MHKHSNLLWISPAFFQDKSGDESYERILKTSRTFSCESQRAPQRKWHQKTRTEIRLHRLMTSFGVVLNQSTLIFQRLPLSDTQGPFLVGYLRKAMSLAPFFTLS